MTDYPYELEKKSKKHNCPACGKRTFVRVIEAATGHYLPDHVGRCDRESKCGYQHTWKQYLADNAQAGIARITSYKKKGISNPASIKKSGLQGAYSQRISTAKPDYLEITHLLDTLKDYEQNSFTQFIQKLFPNDPSTAEEVVKEYLIGTLDGWTVFPTISKTGKLCKAKLMKFDPATGKRLKDQEGKGLISSLEAKLKKAGKLNEDFETDKDVFFGEHLLRKIPDLPIAIVESEKTAVIASICKDAFPFDMVWLATGSKQWLKAERIKRLGPDRTIILYPDADGFEKWQEIASDARRIGLTVKVSNLIERRGTDAEKAKQVDLADYLTGEQQKRNDPARREAFRDLIEEGLAILTIEGGMNEQEAENYLAASGFVEEAIRLVT